MRQKQVDEAIARAFGQQKPRGKCRATLALDNSHIVFYHYQHRILVYDLANKKSIYQWWEKPTDLRILNAALASLIDRESKKK